MKNFCGVHITHEAVQKVGGIGSVVAGLLTSAEYENKIEKSLLYGPLFDIDGSDIAKLGKDGIVLYSGKENYDENGLTKIFKPIEKKYNIKIIYGKRKILHESDRTVSSEVDILLVYINEMFESIVNNYKYDFWNKYNIKSESFKNWDYEQYFRIGIPYYEIIAKLYSEYNIIHFSHEYMGIPSILIMKMNKDYSTGSTINKTIYYAHEIPAVRTIVEGHPGHDITFYNIMEQCRKENKSLEREFTEIGYNYRNELVKKTNEFDYIFTVSDLIKKEYLFLKPDTDEKKLKTVFNGVTSRDITFEKKLQSKNLLQKYCLNLFNYIPDLVFTHVTRLVRSKGLWRDISFLENLDEKFRKNNIKGFYILLSTLIGHGRESYDVYKMEREYGWPVLHRKGWPDLVGMEENIYESINIFNAKSKNIKAVFINQFGFNKHACGNRVPEGASWLDLREGSDAELGFSIYEPFGIAQLETLPYGGIPILSSSCGCTDLLKATDIKPDMYHVVDFLDLDLLKNKLKNLDIKERTELEKEILKKNVSEVFDKLVKVLDRKVYKKRFDSARLISKLISWNSIVKNNIIPVIFGGDKNEL